MSRWSPEEIKEAGLDDFRVFLIEVWAFLGLPRPTPAQLDIAYWLQHGPQRGILQAFRGVGKSWITVAFVLWILLLDPNKKIEVVSANEAAANDFTNFCFQLINGMPLLQHLAPVGDQRKSSERFDVGPAGYSKDPSVKSVGITGQLTGSRADVIIADDIEVPKNSYTKNLRDKLWNQVKEFDAILKPLATSRIIYLGTPQVEESLYVELQDRGYVTAIWPAEIPKNLSVYNGRLGPLILELINKGAKPGDPTDPKRFDRDELEKRRLSYGRTGYALQFMLDVSPDLAEKNPLKLRDLIVMELDKALAHVKLAWGAAKENCINDLVCGGLSGDSYYGPVFKSPEMASYGATVMYIDPSGRGKDETGYAIVKCLHSTLYLVAVGGFKDGYAEATLKGLAAKALRHGVNYVVVEENFGGGMFTALLRPWLAKLGAGKIDDEYKSWSVGQKEARILDVLEPLVQSHRLVVDRRVIEDDAHDLRENRDYSFVYQFTRMQRLKGVLAHDDRIESVAGACAYFTSKMSTDRDRAVEENKEEMLRMSVQQYMEHVTGIGHGGGHIIWNS